MSTALRPECKTHKGYRPSPSRSVLMRLLLASVSRRRTLAHGALTKGKKHCAMGCFWADNPNLPVQTYDVDYVAAINDLTPKATPKARWKRVMKWLRAEVARYG